MKKQQNAHSRMLRRKLSGFFVVCMVMGISFGLAPDSAYAQTTPQAGTSIENQASATYMDNNGNAQTVTSNKVTTTVQQVSALTLTQGTNKSVNPGGQVVFPHTITNNGNGSDAFALTYNNLGRDNGGGDYTPFTSVNIYPDANGDGIADSGTPISVTPSVGIGGTYSFVVVATVPTSPTATGEDAFTLDVTAKSEYDNSVSASTTDNGSQSDIANVTENASVDVLKSQDSNSGPTGSTVRITLKFTNNGNTTAANVQLKDPIPAGFNYVTGSATWSGASAKLGETEGNSDDPAGITFEYNATGNGGNGLVSAVIDELTSGQQATLSFDVKVAEGTQGQTIQNTANYNYANADSPDTNIFGTNPSTNTTSYQVEQSYGVEYVDNNDAADNGVRIKGPVEQGAVVTFVNTFKNTGTTTDRFDISYEEDATNPYPAGTTFSIYKSDGSGNAAGLLTNTAGTADPDIEIEPGATAQVIVRVQLPADASGSGNDGNGYRVNVTATSINDDSKSAVLEDKLTKITANEVDITNNKPYSSADPAPGQGIDSNGEDQAVTTITSDPGTTASFVLYLNNRSGQSDNYNLAASTDPGDFGVGLPAGYSVEFHKGDITGTVVTNSGSVAATSSQKITAVVTIPANASAGTVDIYFRAQSTTSGATDVKHDAIVINEVRSISLEANQTGQIAPGASVIYSHTLTNTGNVNENDGTHSTLQLQVSPDPKTFGTVVVYIDNDKSGTINTGDDQVANGTTGSAVSLGNSKGIDIGTIEPGEVVDLLVKVTANAGVSDGSTYTGTVTISDNGTSKGALASDAVSDITTVVLGNLVINKKQRLDGSSTWVTTGLDAKPGDIIEYQLTVINQGSAEVTSIEVTDSTPAYTTLEGNVTVSDEDATVTAPSDEEAGAIVVKLASLGGGESFTVTFSVQIDQ